VQKVPGRRTFGILAAPYFRNVDSKRREKRETKVSEWCFDACSGFQTMRFCRLWELDLCHAMHFGCNQVLCEPLPKKSSALAPSFGSLTRTGKVEVALSSSGLALRLARDAPLGVRGSSHVTGPHLCLRTGRPLSPSGPFTLVRSFALFLFPAHLIDIERPPFCILDLCNMLPAHIVRSYST
jgi:hypothetical protein